MPMLTDLADACRTSGLTVVEVEGWRTRGHGPMSDVRTIACHHTATSKAAVGDYPSLRIVRDGRSDLHGPLSQLGLGRSGTVYVIAAGVSWHAGVVRDYNYGNSYAIGIEAEADGLSPWPAPQVAAYARLCAALVKHYQLTPADVLGHKEICSPPGRKTDPNFDMAAFRAAVINQMEEDPMAEYADQLAEIKSALATLTRVNQLDKIQADLGKVLAKLDNSADRERKTNQLLRRLRDQVDTTSQAEIDAILSAQD